MNDPNKPLSEEKIKLLIQYIKEEFPEPMENHFTYSIVENVIRNAVENNMGNFALYEITAIIPEVTAEELLCVIED